MIDLSKQYRTRSGLRVILHDIVPYNSAGRLVTFPVKGTVVVREKPFKTDFNIWSADGRADVMFQPHELDLVEIKE